MLDLVIRYEIDHHRRYMNLLADREGLRVLEVFNSTHAIDVDLGNELITLHYYIENAKGQRYLEHRHHSNMRWHPMCGQPFLTVEETLTHEQRVASDTFSIMMRSWEEFPARFRNQAAWLVW